MANNKIELLGWYGGDKAHAMSAWTSTDRDLTEEKRQRIPKLLKMLAEKGHETPFEKSSLHFLVDTEIASHIHLLKHRIGVSINGESARYKEIKEDKYYLPKDWIGCVANIRSEVNEPGDDWHKTLENYTRLGNELYHQCIKDLEPSLGRKRAKESARFFKTYNSQIQADIMFNWRSFVHFQRLRNSLDAQDEIHQIAQEMLDIVKKIDNNPFRYTIEAFGF